MNESNNLDLKIRRAATGDLDALGRLGSELARQHIGYDKLRFSPNDPKAKSFSEFFAGEIENENSVILIAELSGKIVGHAFIRFEPYSFIDLLNAGAWLHDVYLVESARGKSVSKPFFEAIIEEAHNLDSDSLMLSVSPHKRVARKFFEQNGFRQTMQEMCLDFENEENKK